MAGRGGAWLGRGLTLAAARAGCVQQGRMYAEALPQKYTFLLTARYEDPRTRYRQHALRATKSNLCVRSGQVRRVSARVDLQWTV